MTLRCGHFLGHRWDVMQQCCKFYNFSACIVFICRILQNIFDMLVPKVALIPPDIPDYFHCKTYVRGGIPALLIIITNADTSFMTCISVCCMFAKLKYACLALQCADEDALCKIFLQEGVDAKYWHRCHHNRCVFYRRFDGAVYIGISFLLERAHLS